MSGDPYDTLDKENYVELTIRRAAEELARLSELAAGAAYSAAGGRIELNVELSGRGCILKVQATPGTPGELSPPIPPPAYVRLTLDETEELVRELWRAVFGPRPDGEARKDAP